MWCWDGNRRHPDQIRALCKTGWGFSLCLTLFISSLTFGFQSQTWTKVGDGMSDSEARFKHSTEETLGAFCHLHVSLTKLLPTLSKLSKWSPPASNQNSKQTYVLQRNLFFQGLVRGNWHHHWAQAQTRAHSQSPSCDHFRWSAVKEAVHSPFTAWKQCFIHSSLLARPEPQPGSWRSFTSALSFGALLRGKARDCNSLTCRTICSVSF